MLKNVEEGCEGGTIVKKIAKGSTESSNMESGSVKEYTSKVNLLNTDLKHNICQSPKLFHWDKHLQVY